MAGSVVIGTVLLGVFGSTDPAGGNTLASINPAEIWQRPALSMKSNYKSDAPAPDAEPSEVAELKPYSEVSVVFRQRSAGTDSEAPADDSSQGVTGAIVLPARALTGGQGGAYPSISADALPYSSPTVIDGSFQVASLDTGANITIITKTLPEPVDETITLAKNGSLADEIAKLGVTIDQANALATAVEPVFPTTMLKEGQQITVTLERQL